MMRSRRPTVRLLSSLQTLRLQAAALLRILVLAVGVYERRRKYLKLSESLK